MSSQGSSSRTAHDEVLTSGGGGEPSSPKLHAADMSRNLSKSDHQQRRSTSSQQHHSTASRMPRTLNTIPVWARKSSDSSLPPSPPRSGTPVDRGNNTSPKAPKQPKAAFLQSQRGGVRDRGSIDESRMPSTDDDAGTSRFWAFTVPQLWSSGEGQSGSTRKREKSGDTSDAGEVNSRDRKPSLSNTFAASIGDAFTSLAAGAYMGGQNSANKTSSSKNASDEPEGTEKADEQGDVDPLSQNEEEANATVDSEKEAQKKEAEARQRGVEWDASFSRHYQLTPGWDSPWHPETREGNSIEIGRYRYNNFGVGGYFPRVDTSRSNGSNKKKRTMGKNGMSVLLPRDPMKSAWKSVEWWQHFLLDNPFVPLLFRIINVGFTTATLGIAIRLHILLRQQGAEDAVGSSPIAAIVFSPPTLIHVGIQIWLEYFSRPIGLWRVGNKLFYTLIELVFICLWSAELSLSFDNYFTSTLVCTTTLSPYAGDNTLQLLNSQQLNDPAKKPTVCSLQRALIGLVFVSLVAYVIVLGVSLFRIFVRVSRR